MRRFAAVGAVFVLLAAVLAGCSSSASESGTPMVTGVHDEPNNGPYLGAPLVPPRPRPSFVLTDTHGARFDFGARTAGRPTLLFFGYTHCPDECPATMADIALALKSLPEDQQRETSVVFVTTDVERDTGPVLSRWLHRFDRDITTDFVGLRGTQAEIDAAQAAAHIPLAHDDGETHSAQLTLYGPDDYARVAFLVGPSEQKQIAHDLPIVAEG